MAVEMVVCLIVVSALSLYSSRDLSSLRSCTYHCC